MVEKSTEKDYLVLADISGYTFHVAQSSSSMQIRRSPCCWRQSLANSRALFREIGKANALPPLDPAFFRAYGMELVGPPLAIE